MESNSRSPAFEMNGKRIASFPRYSLGKVQHRYIFLPLFGLTPRRRGSPGTISVKFLPKGHRWPRYQMA